MALLDVLHSWAFTFGILGNVISFVVFLSPIPTFYKIYKKKSTEGFQSVPYVVALFSAMLWMYYAFLKTTDASLLITINAIGCFIMIVYIVMFLFYAPRTARILTASYLLMLNIGTFSIILLCTVLLSKGDTRIKVLGWICVIFSVAVSAAPLSVMRLVIRTKSVEFMPFTLSFFLTMSSITWFLYGLLINDYYIAMPNVLGFTFGVSQMVLYMCYKNATSNKQTDITKYTMNDNTKDSDVVINVVNSGVAAVTPVAVGSSCQPRVDDICVIDSRRRLSGEMRAIDHY